MNALSELLYVVDNLDAVAYGVIVWERYTDNEPRVKVEFRNAQELKQNLSKLNFEYDDGYGSQELFGQVVLTDGSWLSRWEYDGSEGWRHNRCPTREEIFPQEPVV